MNRKNMEILFLVILMAMTVMIIGRSMRYDLKTYLLPLLVGIPIFILMIVQMVRELLSKKAAPSSTKEKRAGGGNGVFAACSILVLIFLIYLVGFLVAVPVGVFAYILVSREKWYLALGLGLIMLIVVFVLQVLGLYLYEGILLT